MKSIIIFLTIFPAAIYSQASINYAEQKSDSIKIYNFYKTDSCKVIPIPNKKPLRGQNYAGLIRFSDGNAIKIPNKCKVPSQKVLQPLPGLKK